MCVHWSSQAGKPDLINSLIDQHQRGSFLRLTWRFPSPKASILFASLNLRDLLFTTIGHSMAQLRLCSIGNYLTSVFCRSLTWPPLFSSLPFIISVRGSFIQWLDTWGKAPSITSNILRPWNLPERRGLNPLVPIYVLPVPS